MKIVKSFPPNYRDVCKHFNVKGNPNVIFTYGDTLYSPIGNHITPDLMIHEETHCKQQTEMGAEEWWNKYFVDAKFRFKQELEAYRNQYKYAVENYCRAERRRLLERICIVI